MTEPRPQFRSIREAFGDQTGDAGGPRSHLHLIGSDDAEPFVPANPDEAAAWDPYVATWYVQLPKWILRRTELTPAAKLIYARLIGYKGGKEFAYPSREQLADSVGLSVRQVDDAIRNLKKHGLIRVTRRGLTKSNLYSFLRSPWIEESDLTPGGKRRWVDGSRRSIVGVTATPTPDPIQEPTHKA